MSDANVYPAPDLTTPQFTIRAILTGMIIGGLLSFCNVYLGLKIGWGLNLSVAAALISYGFWQTLHATAGTRHWNKLENNINQTAASSAASISSAGLVAPIPALTLLTGRTWGYWELVIWTFSVSLIGVLVAIALRRQMLIQDKLPFPGGIAAGETLNEMYARGSEAIARVKALIGGAVVGAAMKLTIKFMKIKKIALPGSIGKYQISKLGFLIDPSPLFVAIGAIIGVRAGLSMLFGSIVAFAIMGPILMDNGTVNPGKSPIGPLIQWLLWPGVAMMVTASLTSFGFSWRAIIAAIKGTKGAGVDSTADEVPKQVFLGLLVGVVILSVVLQFLLFGIGWGLATLGVLLTFLLAIVAGRVSGETGITPVGAMGKVTQLTFGAIDPGNATANLMAANVTGGSASQCADLLHDMKTGLMVGASPRLQAYSQFFGVLAGAFCGAIAYIVLVERATYEGLVGIEALRANPDWGLIAVIQWHAVAEVFKEGFAALEVKAPGATAALIWGGAVGIVLAAAEKLLPKKIATWIPSPTAIGIAFVVPAFYSVAMAAGGVLGWVLNKVAKDWSTRFLIVIAAGVAAGDSLAGVFLAVKEVLGF